MHELIYELKVQVVPGLSQVVEEDILESQGYQDMDVNIPPGFCFNLQWKKWCDILYGTFFNPTSYFSCYFTALAAGAKPGE